MNASCSLRQKVMSLALTVCLVFGGGVLAAMASASVDAQPAYAAQAGAWKKSSGKWWYSYNDGSYARGWAEIDGKWYLFDGSGWMKTGWQKSGGKWYYLKGSGAMATGWQKSGGSWYYLKSSGAMATGWYQDGGSWYYSNGSGVMQKSKWVGDYYLQGSGAMATNKWIGKYHVGADGRWDKTSSSSSGQTNSSTVYWVPNGEVYHSTDQCTSLKRSKDIRHGSISKSGKSRPCKLCY